MFPPTDFHTATRVGGQILIIGCLGYVDQREPGYTPVYRLDLATLAIEKVDTCGDTPGWISAHRARLEGSEIVVEGGQLITDSGSLVAADGRYRLSLSDRCWRRER